MGEIMINALPVSVVLCTHTGGSEWLRECVQSILNNDYELFELIVVDSSPDTFIKRLLETSFIGDDRLKHIHIDKKGKSVALNIGVAKAVGELILFTDDDVIVSPQWIRSYVNAFDELKNLDPRIGAMGGPVEGIWLVPRPAWWPPQWLYLTCEWSAGAFYLQMRLDTLEWTPCHDEWEQLKALDGRSPHERK